MGEFEGRRPSRLPGRRGDPRQPRRSGTSLVFLALTAITFIFIGTSNLFAGVRSTLYDIISPFRAVGSTLATPFEDLGASVGSRNDLRAENDDLRRRLAEAQSKVALAEDALRERADLLALEGMEDVQSIEGVTARVGGSSLDNFAVGVEINRGSNDGIAVGMPVVAELSLVGKVIVVTPNSARVRFFTDVGTDVGVRHAASGIVGLSTGNGRGMAMSVSRLEPGTSIALKDPFVSNGGTNSSYPPGFLVGFVSQVEEQEVGLEQVVELESSVDFGRLGFVKVLKWLPPKPVPMARPTTTVLPAPDTTVGSPTTVVAPSTIASTPVASELSAAALVAVP